MLCTGKQTLVLEWVGLNIKQKVECKMRLGVKFNNVEFSNHFSKRGRAG